MKPRKFTKEFIEEAIKLVLENGYTRAEAGRSLGICEKNISRWIQKAQSGPKAKVAPTIEQAELSRLREENKRLRLEREILKKAAAFFANDQK